MITFLSVSSLSLLPLRLESCLFSSPPFLVIMISYIVLHSLPDFILQTPLYLSSFVYFRRREFRLNYRLSVLPLFVFAP